jgi:D-arabinose 1-dehydrogenase-like Zn-dependent alcohol dehydrogenase
VIFFPCWILGREDVELFDGTMGYYHSGLSTFPLVPGHEWAGALAERKKILESFEHVYL